MAETARCAQPGCEESAVIECAYVDEKLQACGTRWCRSHAVMRMGNRYCPRHGSVVAALGENPEKVADLDDRGPALARWIGESIGSWVWEALEEIRDPWTESIVSEPVHRVGHGGTGRWERAWLLRSSGRNTLVVSVAVSDTAPDEVQLLIGEQPVSRTTPPWIANRREGRSLGPDEDEADRQAYDRLLLAALRKALHQVRIPRRPAAP